MNNKYVNRLVEEWKAHGKIILSVDFDDTLYPYRFTSEEDQEEIRDTIKLIKQVQKVGAYLVIFTASNKDRHPEISDFCTQAGIPCDSINQNPIELPYGKEGKIYYNIMLCDRSGLKEAKEILRYAMHIYMGSMNKYNVDNSEFAQFS